MSNDGGDNGRDGNNNGQNNNGNGQNNNGNGQNNNGNGQNNNGNGQNNNGNGQNNNDASNNIVFYTLNETIDASGVEIINQQGYTADGSEITHTLLTTTDITSDIQITEDLIEKIVVYDDEETNCLHKNLVNEIALYANQIECGDFHGKGTIDDYSALFNAAAKIANESKQMQLDIDIDGFSEFGQAADDLSKLFNSFIIKLQNVNIIDDTSFLTSILEALKKIVNLSNVFGKFKETILATTTVQMPKSAHDTAVILENVMSEVNCAMRYISHFVNPSTESPEDANLSQTEQTIIHTAVDTIDKWNTLCEQGVTIAMSNNVDVQNIKQANDSIALSAVTLKNATNALKLKLAAFNV